MDDAGSFDSFCFDALRSSGPFDYSWDAAGSAGWYSAVAGIIASGVLVGMTLRLSLMPKGIRNGTPSSLVWMPAALFTALAAAFLCAEVSGERECNIALGRLIPAGWMLSTAAILLFLSIAWVLAEFASDEATLRFARGLVYAAALTALLFMWTAIRYSDRLIPTVDIPWYQHTFIALVIVAEAFAALLLRKRMHAHVRHLSVWSCGFCVSAAVLIVLVSFLIANEARPGDEAFSGDDVYPGWLTMVIMLTLGTVAAVATLNAPTTVGATSRNRLTR